MIFLIFGLSYFAHGIKTIKHRFIGNLLMVFLIALPIFSTSKVFCRTLKDSFLHSLPSQYERQQKLGQSKFSESLNLISSDSNSTLDICFFLCAGDQGDHSLRTPMRSLSLHFAEGNLIHFPALNTTRPLNVYCLIDPLLANDWSFLQKLIGKFPGSARPTQLDSLTWKVELKALN